MDKEFIKTLVANKADHIASKKSAIKHSDGVACSIQRPHTIKAVAGSEQGVINIKAAINTTLYMDSHDDVHLNGIWNKTVRENKNPLHVQEHKSNEFDKIISSGEDLIPTVEVMSWKDLGLDVEGLTEVLVFDSKVKSTRNPFMFDQYSKGYVINHSVGMQYVKLALSVNDPEYSDEYEEWSKHISMIANKEVAIEKGYFWAVYEAKMIEGSAVPMGSNSITPTISMSQPDSSTGKQQPGKSTAKKGLDLDYITNKLITN